VENRYAPRKRSEPTQAKLRSAISNGSRLLDDVDGRSAWARRLRDLVEDHTVQLGSDANVTEAERRLIRRAAMLTLQSETMERRWATEADGEASTKQLEVYQRTSNSLRRLLESLGLRRRPRDVTPPTLERYATLALSAEVAE